MIVEITIDGSITKNPGGTGGWACIFRLGDKGKVIYGFEERTTNNRMELMAAIKALEHLKTGCQLIIYCDSQYVVKGITEWLKGWKNEDLRPSHLAINKRKTY